MKKSKFTEEQIVYAIKQVEAEVPIPQVCRKYGIGQQSVYTWPRKFARVGVVELRELRRLRSRCCQSGNRQVASAASSSSPRRR